jgi:hypothetical protein
MSRTAGPALPAIALLVASISLPLFSPGSAANVAQACLTAPTGPAPQGSHWYYRVERPSLRKCWRLVQKDAKEQRAAARTQPEPVDATEAAPNPPAVRAAETEATPEPVIKTLVTRNVSNTNEATPPEPAANPAPSAQIANVPMQQAAASEAAPPNPVGQSVTDPAAVADKTDVSAGAPTLGLLLQAIALLGALAGAAFCLMRIVRWRTDVLNAVRDTDEAPFDSAPAATAPALSPLPPMASTRRPPFPRAAELTQLHPDERGAHSPDEAPRRRRMRASSASS